MNLGQVSTFDLITKADATSPIPVATTGTIYTPAFRLEGVEGVEIIAASTGVVDVLVKLETSNVLPTTEEAADSEYTVPDGFADVMNVTDETKHSRELGAPKGDKYGRFKLIGQGSNDASTTLRIRIARKEYP